ncbi:uncharacterized protein Tco025E_08155 [Trypanosoma conorhini]|uniref:Uncharacterized protein n=1 Tax=Trypanosoma conorhini TaxID=83891 RepID=A0A3R7NJP5_9TRYP|nr:uncharacterized protein Tco025E_08155 [Trypanosoma conorhini]RNF03601.1 hypothetical protein Tco025E_08155 [Trypanosoma conorhini]
MERPSVELVVPSVKVNAGDAIRLEVEGAKCTMHSLSSLGESSVTFSDYEVDSDTLSAVGEEAVRVEVMAWKLHLNGVPAADVASAMLGLWSELGVMANALSRRKLVTCDSLRGEQHNLSRTGPWFFDAPGKVVLVEDCAFLSRASGTQMVVCSGTHVYFRRCHFSSCFLLAITVQDESASFVCDNCVEAALGNDASVTAVRAEAERKTLQKLLLIAHRSIVCVTLPCDRKLTLSLSTLDLRFMACLRKTVSQLRVQRGRLDLSEKGTTHGVISRVDLDVDWAHRQKDDYAALSSAVRIGGVSIPVSLVFAVRRLRRLWGCKQPFSGDPRRKYQMPSKPRGFPFARWKALLTTSAIPVGLCLPSGAPFMHFLLASTSLLSKREVTGDAFVEARLGMQELSLWEFSSQAQVPLLRDLLSVLVVARTHDLSTVSCDVSVSPCEFSLSSEQLKSALSLLTFLQGGDDDAAVAAGTTPCAMELGNRLGVEVTLQDATEQFCLQDCLSLERKTLLFPDCLRLVGGRRVDRFDREDISFSDDKRDGLFHAEGVAVLEDGERVHVATRVQPGTLTLQVTLRTAFHVRDYLPCAVTLRPTRSGSEVLTLRPGELACLPIAYLDSTDVVMRLVSTEEGGESCDELLCEGPPRKLLEVATSRGTDSMGRLKKFSFAGASAYVDVTYQLRSSVLTMLLAPARSGIHNGTRFPIRLTAYISDDVAEEASVDPGKTFVSLRHDPYGPPVEYLFECVVYGMRYVASERVDVTTVDPAEGECIVMKHEEFPRRYFFEFNIEARQADLSGGGAQVYSVVPRYIFGVENNSHMDVEFVSEAGDSIGTLGGTLLSCSSGSNFAYLPLHASLVLRAEKATSSAFEVGEGLDEQMLLCNASEQGETPCGAHCFLLRVKGDAAARTMELLPALLMLNLDATRTLSVQHAIRAKDTTTGGEEKWVRRVVLPAAGVLPYTFISCYGYLDTFAFCWEESGEAASYSTPVVVTFASNTDWTGVVQCGRTHHMVQVRKKGSCDPAMLVVSGPCNRPSLTLVNLTPKAYHQVGSMAVSSSLRLLAKGDVLSLSEGDKESVVCLARDAATDIGDAATAFVRHQRDDVTVVLSLFPLNTTVLLPGSTCAASNPQMGGGVEEVGAGIKTTIRVNAKASQVSLTVRDGRESSLLFTVESSEFWMVHHSLSLTAQGTVSNASVQSTYNSKRCHVLKPFCFDMTVRDVELLFSTISACSAQVNVTRLEVELSDILLYQFHQLATHCQDYSLKTTTRERRRGANACLAIAVDPPPPSPSLCSMHRRVEIGSMVVCEICVILTYDRGERAPADVLFRGSPIGRFIPSLHRATMRLPTLRFRDISRETLMEVYSMVKEVMLFEFLKQLPSLVSSVVWFPALSPVGSFLTRVGSFIFGTSGASSELPGATLI